MGKNQKNGKEQKKVAIKGDFINASILLNCLSIPSYTMREEHLKLYIKQFCEKNDIVYEEDTYGNVFITKGELSEGEYYPCVTSHLDTVQFIPFLSRELKLIDINVDYDSTGRTLLYSPDCGVGADDKAGVAICLSLLEKQEKLKVFFPVREEFGCWGSYSAFKDNHANWFDNVGYVIGFDSPEGDRAAWCSHGTMLFNEDFFTEHLQEVCSENGITKFRSEPYTDVKAIRENTELVCMNFGNGGYLAHSTSEFLVFEETDNACKLGMDLINKLTYNQYKLPNEVIKSAKNKDYQFFEKLLKEAIKQKPTPRVTDPDGGSLGINDLQTIKEKVNLLCKKFNVPFDEFEKCFQWECSDGSEFFPQEEDMLQMVDGLEIKVGEETEN